MSAFGGKADTNDPKADIEFAAPPCDAETKRELKAQSKSAAAAGQMSRARTAPDAITVKLPALHC
jgi:hypothetical protein